MSTIISFVNSFSFILVLILAPACKATKDIANIENGGRKPSSKEKVEEPAYFEQNMVTYDTKIFDEKVKTLLIHQKISELDHPVIKLNGPEKLVLQFDDLGENLRDMHYVFEHCTHDWKPSGLQKMDYQNGFPSDIISDYDFSFNTVRPYVHYKLEFPNSRIGLTRSGNYIIKIYANDDPDQVILSARFMIVEPLAGISATIRPSSVVSEREYRQEVDITVNLGSVNSMNPYSEIELVVLQNYRWDNAKTSVKPSFVKDKQLTYNYQGPFDI